MAWSISWLQVTEVTDHVHCRDRSRGGHGKARDEWFPLTQAVVVYDHARHAPLADVITLDFINAGLEPGVPAGIELTLETAKELLAAEGFAVPAGTLIRDLEYDAAELPPGPWMVKAQIAAGGRGKAGLIRSARNTEELRAALHAILGATHQGVAVRACRIEQLFVSPHAGLL